MRVFYVLLAVAVLLSVAVNLSADLRVGQEAVAPTTSQFELEALQAKHGHIRNLSHSQTRNLYHSLLRDIETTVTDLQEELTESESAVVCSVMRSSARKYARQRDSLSVSLPVLQIRDSYVHAIRFLPLALRKDARETLMLRRPTLRHTAMVLKQGFVCLAPHLTNSECPSYTFLKDVRGKADREILKTCVLSNKAYDLSYGG